MYLPAGYLAANKALKRAEHVRIRLLGSWRSKLVRLIEPLLCKCGPFERRKLSERLMFNSG